MKKSSGSTLRILLIIGDAFVIFFSFAAAYFFRTYLSNRPFYFEAKLSDFILSVVLLIPIWLIILAALGLYKRSIFLSRSHLSEIGRIFLASILGTMGLISADFFFNLDLFPVRTIALLATILCFVLMVVLRCFLRFIRKKFLQKSNRAALRAVIIGNNGNTSRLVNYLYGSPESGYRVSGVVADEKYIEDLPQRIHTYETIEEAFEKAKPEVVFQTDKHKTEEIYKKSVEHHIPYYFIPSEATLASQLGELELIGNMPAILVKVTPLAGAGKIIKRFFDIFLGSILLILALIPMGIVWLSIKISDPKNPAIFSDIRLTKFNREFKIYKFRSMKSEYSGITPEEAFEKMGKKELIKKYRDNGDYLPNDPRVTKIGRFIRRTSLDELPQLWNVVKGDISLIGPRALIPGELKNYGDRSLLLSIKSGLTGLAQVSGRRDISFEERRAIDIYYVNNWSLFLDLQIFLKTIATIFKREGAK